MSKAKKSVDTPHSSLSYFKLPQEKERRRVGLPQHKVELLAPAGNLEKLKIAFYYGADAVYLAGKEFGLRAAAGNFSLEEMAEGLKIARELGKKVYVTVNIFAHNYDLPRLPAYLQELQALEVDGLIISDPGVLWLAKQYAPSIPVHLSTQANTTNWASCQFWAEQGVKRIVLSRELSLQEIAEIKDKVSIELEAFVHGAMCISYSGRCMLSSFLAGRSANRGLCTHPCRWKYFLVEEKRPGEYMPVEEDERGTYIFNSKDLCMLEYIPELIKAGITSFKIEGRMKSIHYVATVIKAYRQALDAYYADPEGYRFDNKWLEEVNKVSEREYTTGFYFQKPDSQAYNYGTTKLPRAYNFVGLVLDYNAEKNLAMVEQRNRFAVGEVLEVFGPHTDCRTFKVTEMFDAEGQPILNAPHPQQKVFLKVEFPLEPYSLLRRKND